MATYDEMMESMLKPTKPVDNVGPSLAKEDTLAKAAEVLKDIADVLASQGKTIDGVLEELEESAETEEKNLEDIKKELKKANKPKRNRKEDRLVGAVEELAEAMGSSKSPSATLGGGGFRGRGGDVATDVARTTVKMDTEAAASTFGDNLGKTLTDVINSSTKFFIAGMLGGASAYAVLTKGMIADEYEFASSMNLIAYQTEAITGEAYSMQKAFRQTGDIVRETGFDVTTFQDQLVKMARRGIKDAVKINKIGLGLGKMMGLNEQQSASISDTFGDWSRKLGLSTIQISGISRGIQDIARTSGLVGEELISVVKESESYLDNMRAAGTLTAESAENTIGLLAEAKKLGVTEDMGKLLNGMNGAADLLLNSSDGTKTLLITSAAAMGKTQELLNGTLRQSKAGIKEMSVGMEETFMRFSGGLGFDQIKNMSAKQKSDTNLRLKGSDLPALDDFKRIFESFKNESMSFEERMESIKGELGKHATAEEKLANARKKQEYLTSRAFKFSSELATAADQADTFDDALTNMQKSMGDTAWSEKLKDLSQVTAQFDKDLAGKVAKGDKDAITQAMATSSAMALKQEGGKDFTRDINKVVKNKDVAGMRDLQSKIDAELQKKRIDTSVSTDPVEKAFLELKAINETIRDYTGEMVMYLATIAGSTGILTMLFAAMGAQAFFAGKQFYDIIRMGTTMFGSRAASTATAASTVGRTAATGGRAAAAVSPTAAAVSPTAAQMATGTIGGARTNMVAGAINPSAAQMATGTIGGVRTNMGALTTSATQASAATTTAATAATQATSALSKALRLLGKIAAPLGMLIGAVTGYFQAEKEGITAIEGMLFGAITGDATKGSMFSGMLGLEKGGAADLGLGVAGAGINAAAIGAGIGTLVAPGVGTAIGAALGGVIGIITELFKIFRDDIMAVGKVLLEVVKFALKPFIYLVQAVAGIVVGLGKAIYNIGVGIADGIYAIFEPFGAIFSAFGDIITAITTPMNIFWGEGQKAIDIFGMVSGAIGYVGKLIGDVFRFIGGTIGAVVKFAIEPLVFALKTVAVFIMAVKDTFAGLIEIIMGLLRFDFNQLQSGIAKFISSIPMMIMSAIEAWGNMVMGRFKAIFFSLPNMLMESLMSLASNEWFGPIFEPFVELLAPLRDAMHEVYNAGLEFYTAIKQLFVPIYDAIMGFFESFNIGSYFGSTGKSISIFKSVIKGISKAIGIMIKISLIPLSIVVKTLTVIFKTAAKIIKFLITPIQFAIESIQRIMMLFSSIKTWFVDKILSAFGLISGVSKTVGKIGAAIGEGILDAFLTFIFGPMGPLIYDALTGTLGKDIYDAFVYVSDGIVEIFHSIIDSIKSYLPWPFNSSEKTHAEINKSQLGTTAQLASDTAKAGTIEDKQFALKNKYEMKKGIEHNIANKAWYESSADDKAALKTVEESIKVLEESLKNDPRNKAIPENIAIRPGEIHQITGQIPPEHNSKLIEQGYKHGGPAFAAEEAARRKALLQDEVSNMMIRAQAEKRRKLAIDAAGPGGKVIPAPHTIEKNQSTFDKTIQGQQTKYRDAFSLETTGVEDKTSGKVAQMTTPLGSPSAIEPAVATMQPVPLTDVHREIQREQAQTNGSSTATLTPHLTEMVSINDRQLEFLILLHGDMQEVVELLKPNNRSSGNTYVGQKDSKSRSKPVGSPNYYHWQFGRYDQNASQNIITDGR